MSEIEKLRELLETLPSKRLAVSKRDDGTAQLYSPSRGIMRVVVPVAETEAKYADVLAAAVNALPALLDVAEAARGLVDTLRPFRMQMSQCATISPEKLDALRAALSRLGGE